MKKRQSLILLAAALLVSGCGPKGCRNDASSGLSAADLPAPAFGDTTLVGRVTFAGDAPTMPLIDAGKTLRG